MRWLKVVGESEVVLGEKWVVLVVRCVVAKEDGHVSYHVIYIDALPIETTST